LNISRGYLYNNSGARPGGRDKIWEELNVFNVSAGLSNSFLDNSLKLTVAELLSLYTPEDINKGVVIRFFPEGCTRSAMTP